MLDTYEAEVVDFLAALQGRSGIGADGAAGAQLVGIIEAAVRGWGLGQDRVIGVDKDLSLVTPRGQGLS
jgi:hypothetical protein